MSEQTNSGELRARRTKLSADNLEERNCELQGVREKAAFTAVV